MRPGANKAIQAVATSSHEGFRPLQDRADSAHARFSKPDNACLWQRRIVQLGPASRKQTTRTPLIERGPYCCQGSAIRASPCAPAWRLTSWFQSRAGMSPESCRRAEWRPNRLASCPASMRPKGTCPASRVLPKSRSALEPTAENWSSATLLIRCQTENRRSRSGAFNVVMQKGIAGFETWAVTRAPGKEDGNSWHGTALAAGVI